MPKVYKLAVLVFTIPSTYSKTCLKTDPLLNGNIFRSLDFGAENDDK
jgi:hypothetical protein